MSQTVLKLDATTRKGTGTSESRKMRTKDNLVPAIIYGGGAEPTTVSFDHNKVWKALENESFYSQILTVKVDAKEQKVVLKDVQRHPHRKIIQHMDFMRVSETDVITMKVPLHFINEYKCPGIKAGGVINHMAIDVEVRCQAKNLPEYIEVDVINLEIDQSIHLSELVLPQGVEVASLAMSSDHDTAIVNIHIPRQMKEETPEENTASKDTAADSAEEDKKE